ncbi:nucleotide disphospho-sugar-binding domain-containing protein [Actinoallomurus sp. CA-150999]|uniref:nucleotide disphospho-sugar-binding domain-containing protein n=1 Tax=Actinoallomurus sp. CA-150999 TaxID=3239887 RepID=UPI003D944468
MRVLFVSTPVPSHLTPLTPLAWALRAAGHEVLVTGQPDVMSAAHAAGLSGVPVGEPFNVNELLRRHLPDGVRLIHVVGPTTTATILRGAEMWRMRARQMLPHYLELARAWRPDMVITDPLEFAGPVVAGALRVPYVQHRWGVDALGDPSRVSAREFLQPECDRLGLDRLPEPAIILDPCPPELQIPGLTPAHPIRHIPVNGTRPAPAWAARRTARHRVCVSLGRQTAHLNGLPLIRTIIAGAAGLDDVETIVTAAPDHHAELGPVPPSVRLVAPTPLDRFLHTCDVVIHHGGASTTLTVTAEGVPQLVLPQFADQFGHAERIAALGAGIALDDDVRQDDPAAIRDAVDALLSEPRYRASATRLGHVMAAMPSPAEVVRTLEGLVPLPVGA